MKELVSVIIPVYNVEPYLKCCVESIRRQTYREIEIILIDDGSTDKSSAYCEEYADLDERVRVIHQENQGLSAARNAGIEIARGEYLTFVDSDDFVHECMIEILVRLIKKENADISACGYREVFCHEKLDNEVRKYFPVCRSATEELRELFGKQRIPVVVAWGKIYKKTLWRGIRYPEGKLHEDELTTYKLISRAKKIVHTKAEMYYYYQRPDSIMGSGFSERKLELLGGLREQITYFEKEKIYSVIPEAVFNYLRRIAMSYCYYKDSRGKAEILEQLKDGYRREYARLLRYTKRLGLFKKGILEVFRLNINSGIMLVKIKKFKRKIKMGNIERMKSK